MAVDVSLVPPILGAVNAFHGDYAQKYGLPLKKGQVSNKRYKV
jgi:hypothetical protein